MESASIGFEECLINDNEVQNLINQLQRNIY